MPTPAYNQNEHSELNESAPASRKEAVLARLPRANNRGSDVGSPPPPGERLLLTSSPQPAPRAWRWKFLPAFWTIASVLSMIVNVGLIIILLLAFQMLNQIERVQSIATDVLGGLHTNFVRMDQANIQTTIRVEKDIPVNFNLSVSGPTVVRLSQPVRITGAVVSVSTGGLRITDADATIVLPQGIDLPVTIRDLVVPVDQRVPAVLDVPVNIPLRQTELHEPFVGLRKVVEPWYCLIKPQATFNGLSVCSGAMDATLNDPALTAPTPAGTVTP
jgi:hypothetical protein